MIFCRPHHHASQFQPVSPVDPQISAEAQGQETRVAIGRSMAARLGDRRGGDHGNQYTGGKGQISALCHEEKTRDLAAEKSGLGSHFTYGQAEKVCDEGVPELISLMDIGAISISAAADLVKLPEDTQRRAVEKIATGVKPRESLRQIKAEDLQRDVPDPTDKYRVIYADPPWEYGNNMPHTGTEPRDYYPTMPLKELCEIPVIDWCEQNAVLFLWVTSPMLQESFRLINAWGFEYKTSFVWDKVKHNVGHYNSVRHEFLLVCTRGACLPDIPRLFDSVITEERREHSRKPDVVYEIIETLYPHGKRIELFARGKREGWESYGFEV